MDNSSHEKFKFFLRAGQDVVFLIHGITGTPSEMYHIGRALHKSGFSVFCNVLPRHCGTLGELKQVTWTEIADACRDDFLRLKQEYRKVFVGGLSMGALMAVHLAAKFPSDVSGIAALAPTFFYDGWALHKGKIFMDAVWHIPFLRNRINIREGSPYGLKDEVLRGHIERFYTLAKASEYDNKVLLFGSPFFPLTCLYQHHLFVKVVKKELPAVKTPILILHAREDDMTSLKNAEYLMDNIGSQDKTLVILENSYHMITIDQEKNRVAQEIVGFFNAL
jgi:carboxylesterase